VEAGLRPPHAQPLAAGEQEGGGSVSIGTTDLSEWFDHHARREQRRPSLEEALFNDRFAGYIWYRLRFFLLRYACDSVLCAIRFVFLFRMFSHSQFYTLLVAQTVADMACGFWWGALETMRGQVRQLYRSGRPLQIPRTLGAWLSLSALLASLVLVGGAVWISLTVVHSQGRFDAVDLYMVSIVIGLALMVVTRCYHSGVYAVRRVFRPMSAMMVVELAAFCATLGLWPLLGQWSIPAAAMVSMATTTAVQLRYTHRAYRFLGMKPVDFVSLRARPRLRDAMAEFVGAGFSNVVISMDSIIVLTLATHAGRHSALYVLFFAVSPTIRAGYGWAHMFYFDLKRLDTELFGHLRHRFRVRLLTLAGIVGVASWLAAIGIATPVYQHGLGRLYWLLLPFLLARSLLALGHVSAFTARAYSTVVLSGAVLVMVMVSCVVSGAPEQTRLVDVSVATAALGLAVTVLVHHRPTSRTPAGELLHLSAWLSELASVTQPLVIGVAHLREGRRVAAPGQEDVDRAHQRELAHQLARRLRRRGRVTLIRPDRIAWYEPRDSVGSVDDEWLIIRGAGLVRGVERSWTPCSGAAAVSAALALGVIDRGAPSNGHGEPSPRCVGDVHATFRRLFPDGVLYSTDRPAPSAIQRLSPTARRHIVNDAMRFARDYSLSERRSRHEVTALCVRGGLRDVFVVDRRQNPQARSRWRAFIREANLFAAQGALQP